MPKALQFTNGPVSLYGPSMGTDYLDPHNHKSPTTHQFQLSGIFFCTIFDEECDPDGLR